MKNISGKMKNVREKVKKAKGVGTMFFRSPEKICRGCKNLQGLRN